MQFKIHSIHSAIFTVYYTLNNIHSIHSDNPGRSTPASMKILSFWYGRVKNERVTRHSEWRNNTIKAEKILDRCDIHTAELKAILGAVMADRDCNESNRIIIVTDSRSFNQSISKYQQINPLVNKILEKVERVTVCSDFFGCLVIVELEATKRQIEQQ